MAKAVIAGGVGAVAAVSGAGWYALRSVQRAKLTALLEAAPPWSRPEMASLIPGLVKEHLPIFSTVTANEAFTEIANREVEILDYLSTVVPGLTELRQAWGTGVRSVKSAAQQLQEAAVGVQRKVQNTGRNISNRAEDATSGSRSYRETLTSYLPWSGEEDLEEEEEERSYAGWIVSGGYFLLRVAGAGVMIHRSLAAGDTNKMAIAKAAGILLVPYAAPTYLSYLAVNQYVVPRLPG